jgi:hypothetical protein
MSGGSQRGPLPRVRLAGDRVSSDAVLKSVLGYLDPGSGSMILQAVVGGAAAAAVVGKLYWRRFLQILRIRKKND